MRIAALGIAVAVAVGCASNVCVVVDRATCPQTPQIDLDARCAEAVKGEKLVPCLARGCTPPGAVVKLTSITCGALPADVWCCQEAQ